MGKRKTSGAARLKRAQRAGKAAIVRSEPVFQGRIFSVTRDTAIEPGGIEVVREVVRHAGSAVIVPRRADGRILLVRQFRLPTRRFMWELVAGRRDPGEGPLRAARRECGRKRG